MTGSTESAAGAVNAAPAQRRQAKKNQARKNKAQRRKAQLAAWGFIAPVVIYLAACYAYPLYRNIDLSVHSYTVTSFVAGNAPFAGFAEYTGIFRNSTFAPALVNTTIFVFVSIAFQFDTNTKIVVLTRAGVNVEFLKIPVYSDNPANGALPETKDVTV